MLRLTEEKLGRLELMADAYLTAYACPSTTAPTGSLGYYDPARNGYRNA